MPAVDTRVVQIKFDNAQFEAAIQKTLSSLTALNSGLQLNGATKGLAGISSAASKVDLQPISDNVGKIASRFNAMSVVAITALSNITTKAISAGTALVKSLTVDPIKAGFSEYETGLNSVQTILANTQAAGTGLKEVNATLEELNRYSDQTIYNFGEMAKNIGTFTAAGVDLKTATASIKGIANLAALSGSNSEQASGAMYQLSQAISAGRVSLEDWNSVVNAGMGGTVFQRALAQNAERLGTLSDGAVKLKGSMKNVTIEGKSFRESITARPGEQSWLTSEVLTSTLSQFTGDLSDAELAAQGFNDAQIKAIQSQAKTAQDAATQVKTLTQLLGTMREAAGSGWAQTWQLIFGDFEEAKALFTDVNNVLGGFISTSSEARNHVVKDWKELGGRTVLIESISNAFDALISVIKPIRDAFREIFPAATGKQLYDLSVSIRNFTQGLSIGSATADKLRRTFAGVFAIFGIGFEIIKQIAKTFFGLFTTVGEGSGAFLDITANVGDFLVALHEAIVNGEGLSKFFSGLGKILSYPIKAFQILISVLAAAFGPSAAIDGIQERFAPLGVLGEVISKAWSAVANIFDRVADAFSNAAPLISGAFTTVMDAFADSFSNGNFEHILDALNTGLLAGLVLAIRSFLDGGFLGDLAGGGGFFDTITDAFGDLTGTLQSMQALLKVSVLLKIAAAVSLLTVSVVALSMIDSGKLAKALTAITIMFTQLMGAMYLFSVATAGAGFVRLPVLATALISLSIAVDLLAIAVAKLAKLDWVDLAKGLGGITVLLGVLVAATKGLAGQGPGMVSAGAGLILLAGAIKILVSALTDISGLSWEELGQGLVGVGSLLGALALFSKFASANAGGVLAGAGIVLLAGGIKILASALRDISNLSWESLAQGLVGMAGGLTLMAAALLLIPPTGVLSAAAVLITATSLNILAVALSQMSEMTWGEIAKGLIVLAGSLTIIAAAMIVMTTALPGAAALLVVSGALAIFVPVLRSLAGMTWGEIAKGLIALAGSLLIIGVAGTFLGPIVPILLGLGGAVLLLGTGMFAAGAGVAAFAIGLGAIAAVGAAAAGAVVGIVKALLGLIVDVAKGIAAGLVAFVKAIAAAAPAVFKAMSTTIQAMLSAFRKIAPDIIRTLIKFISDFLSELAKATPRIVSSGIKMLQGLLDGINRNIGKIADTAARIIVNFLNGISRNLGRIIDAGVKLIISFINGMASAIRNNSAQLNAAGANLASAIVEGMARGLAAGAGRIASKAREVAQGALNAAKSALGINSPSKEFEKIGKFVNDGFVKGLGGNSASVTDTFKRLNEYIKTAYAAAGDDITRLEAKMKRLTSARKRDNKEIAATLKELTTARSERAKTKAAYTELTKNLDDERDRLKKLANSYDKVTDRLSLAQDKLKDAIKTRDDYKAQVKSQYSDLPDITSDVKLEDYMNQLREQIVKTKAFAAQLQKLRALGLNDTLYQELLAKGVDAMPFVSQLLDSGKAGVTELNGLNKNLEATAGKLGKTASDNLYDAAVRSAQGLVDGLKKQQKAIERVMDAIADSMVKAIKKKLKIKSPSRVFMEIGKYSAQGMAQGLTQTSAVVSKAADLVGKDAILALQKSISTVKMGVDSSSLTPVIRPIIDLTEIKRGAGEMHKLLPATQAISVGTSYTQARAARRSYDSIRDINTQPIDTPKNAAPVQFIQNNNSPKALTSAEIYRQTRNQLSMAKGALTK